MSRPVLPLSWLMLKCYEGPINKYIQRNFEIFDRLPHCISCNLLNGLSNCLTNCLSTNFPSGAKMQRMRTFVIYRHKMKCIRLKTDSNWFTNLWKKWSVTIGSNWWIPCILIHPVFIIHWSLSNYQFILFKKHVLLFMLQNSILKNGWKYPLGFFWLGTTWQLFAHFQ